MGLSTVVQQLKMELENKNVEARKISKAIQLLQDGEETTQSRVGHKMSPEGIARIKAASKKYWANKRKGLLSSKGK